MPAVTEVSVWAGFIVEGRALEECEGFSVDPCDCEIETVSSLDRNVGLTDSKQAVAGRKIFAVLAEILLIRCEAQLVPRTDRYSRSDT